MNKAILKGYKSLGIKTLKLSQIKLDQGIYPRFETDEERAKFFAKLLEEGNEFDPVIVAPTDTEGLYELLDGNHRLLAHQIAGKEEIRAEIYDVPKEERRLVSAGLNNKTSKPLSEAELKDAIVKAYTVDGIKNLKKIASLIGCSLRTVERYTKEIREREREQKIRKAFGLRKQGKTVKEISEILGEPKSTIEKWLYSKELQKRHLSQIAKLPLLLPTGAPTPEGLRLWSEYVEQGDVKTLNDAFNESGFYSFLKNKGYEEAEYYGQFITTVRDEIFTYVEKLVNAGMSETAIRTALSKENKGIFKHLSSTAKAKLAGLLRDYIQNLVKKREQRQEEENKILESAKEILKDPQYVFSNWYNLAKEILNRLEEQGEYLRHRHTPRDISPILQQHSDELLRLYNSIPEVSEEELKEIVQSLNLGEFEDLRQLKETLRATVLQKGKRPAGVETFATELWNEYWSKKLKEDSPEESSPSQETLSDGTPLVRTYTDEQIEEMARAANEASEEIFEEKKEERKRGPKGPHPYKTEKPKTAEEELRQNTDWIKAHILWIIDKFGRKKAKEIVSEIYHDLETLPNSQLWKKWQIAYAYAHSKLGIRSYEYWKDEV